MSTSSGGIQRRTFITVGGVGLGAILAGGHLSRGQAFAAEPAPTPGTGGTPPGPHTYGWNAKDVLDFDPAGDEWSKYLVCQVPLAPRIAAFTPTQAHPDLDPAVQLSTLTMDDAGSRYEGHAQPYGREQYVYTQRFWPYIDIWGTWHGQVLSHVPSEIVAKKGAVGRDYGVIDIPNPGWVEAAHLNGAKAIGGWFWPRRTMNFDEFLVQDPDGSYPLARKLIEIKDYFGFDGLFINQEDSITTPQVIKLIEMFAQLKDLDPDFYLQIYDAIRPDTGNLTYQNELNSDNLPWLGTPEKPLMDSIFINYAWPYVDKDLSKSAAAAKAAGWDPLKVGFAGVEHQKGKFNPEERFADVAAPGKPGPTSMALFVDSGFWHEGAVIGKVHSPEGRATFRDYEQRFWSGPSGNPATTGRQKPRPAPRTNPFDYLSWDGIAHSITERSTYGSLPIATSFVIGVGSGFWLNGTKVRDTGWDHQGCADRSLTWQYWTEGDLTITLDETDAFEGAHSLRCTGDGVAHLLKTELVAGVIRVVVTAKGFTKVDVGVTYADAPETISWHSLSAEANDGWVERQGRIRTNGRTVARVSLRVAGAGQLGKIVLDEPQRAARTAPSKPSGVQVKQHSTSVEAGRVHLTFEWQHGTRAQSYDILQVSAVGTTWIGRSRRDCHFAESVDLSAGRTFHLVAIGYDGSRSAPAISTL